MKALNVIRDSYGDVINVRDSILPMSDNCTDVTALSAGATGISVPEGAKYAVFNAKGNFYINTSGAAAPTTDTGGAQTYLNPTALIVTGIPFLTVAGTGADVRVNIAFYN